MEDGVREGGVGGEGDKEGDGDEEEKEGGVGVVIVVVEEEGVVGEEVVGEEIRLEEEEEEDDDDEDDGEGEGEAEMSVKVSKSLAIQDAEFFDPRQSSDSRLEHTLPIIPTSSSAPIPTSRDVSPRAAWNTHQLRLSPTPATNPTWGKQNRGKGRTRNTSDTSRICRDRNSPHSSRCPTVSNPAETATEERRATEDRESAVERAEECVNPLTP
jgi:hypothetical protein